MNPDYILLLNNDTVVDKYFLDELVQLQKKTQVLDFLAPKYITMNSMVKRISSILQVVKTIYGNLNQVTWAINN